MDGTSQADTIAARSAQTMVIRSALFAAIFVLTLLSILLALRGYRVPFATLSASTLLMTTLCIAIIVDVWRFALHKTDTVLRRRAWIGDVVATLLLVLLISAVSIRSTAWARSAVWCLVVFHELAFYLITRIDIVRRLLAQLATAAHTPRGETLSRANLGDNDCELGEQALTQRVLRWSEEDEEFVLAEFKCVFAAQERQQAIHVVFCPPLALTPSLTLEHLSGPPATLKTTQCYTFGARVDVRLSSAAPSPTSVAVRVLAQAPSMAAVASAENG